jgi:hypothetical protein
MKQLTSHYVLIMANPQINKQEYFAAKNVILLKFVRNIKLSMATL